MKKYSIVIVVGWLLCMLTSSVYAHENHASSQTPSVSMKRFNDIIVGHNEAPITIVEYFSMSCYHCAQFHLSVFPKLKKNYIDTGKVRIILRQFPLDQASFNAALMIHCADQVHQHTYLEALFKTQSSWAFTKQYLEKLEAVANVGGMGGDRFYACIKNDGLQTQLLEERLYAENILKVKSTPSFFLNNRLFEGKPTYKSLSKALDVLLQAS